MLEWDPKIYLKLDLDYEKAFTFKKSNYRTF